MIIMIRTNNKWWIIIPKKQEQSWTKRIFLLISLTIKIITLDQIFFLFVIDGWTCYLLRGNILKLNTHCKTPSPIMIMIVMVIIKVTETGTTAIKYITYVNYLFYIISAVTNMISNECITIPILWSIIAKWIYVGNNEISKYKMFTDLLMNNKTFI